MSGKQNKTKNLLISIAVCRLYSLILINNEQNSINKNISWLFLFLCGKIINDICLT